VSEDADVSITSEIFHNYSLRLNATNCWRPPASVTSNVAFVASADWISITRNIKKSFPCCWQHY
jgi:hypothetical protein